MPNWSDDQPDQCTSINGCKSQNRVTVLTLKTSPTRLVPSYDNVCYNGSIVPGTIIKSDQYWAYPLVVKSDTYNEYKIPYQFLYNIANLILYKTTITTYEYGLDTNYSNIFIQTSATSGPVKSVVDTLDPYKITYNNRTIKSVGIITGKHYVYALLENVSSTPKSTFIYLGNYITAQTKDITIDNVLPE